MWFVYASGPGSGSCISDLLGPRVSGKCVSGSGGYKSVLVAVVVCIRIEYDRSLCRGSYVLFYRRSVSIVCEMDVGVIVSAYGSW